jgi:hypothetical protein
MIWPLSDDLLPSNPPVNPDARASIVPCKGLWARAGYWERYVSLAGARGLRQN